MILTEIFPSNFDFFEQFFLKKKTEKINVKEDQQNMQVIALSCLSHSRELLSPCSRSSIPFSFHFLT